MDGLEGLASRDDFAVVVCDRANKLGKGIGGHSCEYLSDRTRGVFILQYGDGDGDEVGIGPTLFIGHDHQD